MEIPRPKDIIADKRKDPTNNGILQIKNLTKYFGGLAAVSNCSLKIKKGSITGIIGPNGSGKTTLFNLIAGNLKSSQGKVIFNNGSEYANITADSTSITFNIDSDKIFSIESDKVVVTKKFKVPDILINAGCIRPMQHFFHDSVENWDKSMSVNARGIFITCRAFGNEMAKQGMGSIINISSVYGMVAPDMNIYEGSNFETEPDYPFLKGGIISFTKYLASYFSKNNVRVNCISPGGFFDNQPEPFLTKYVNKTPLGRMATHDDMKGVALFLASDSSSYITGSVIPVDGGWTAI